MSDSKGKRLKRAESNEKKNHYGDGKAKAKKNYGFNKTSLPQKIRRKKKFEKKKRRTKKITCKSAKHIIYIYIYIYMYLLNSVAFYEHVRACAHMSMLWTYKNMSAENKPQKINTSEILIKQKGLIEYFTRIFFPTTKKVWWTCNKMNYKIFFKSCFILLLFSMNNYSVAWKEWRYEYIFLFNTFLQKCAHISNFLVLIKQCYLGYNFFYL